MKKMLYGIKTSLITALVMCVIMTLYTSLYERTAEVRLNKGDSGDSVVMVQEKLKELGLYGGKCDGVYNVETADAVRRFQEYNGIEANGVCGNETLRALGLNIYTYNDLELDALAKLIEAEAGDTDLQTMTAVGAVVVNRLNDASFPDSVIQIIYSGGSFDSVTNGSIHNAQPSELAYRAANDAMVGFDPTNGALYVLHGGSYGKTVTLKLGDIFFAK